MNLTESELNPPLYQVTVEVQAAVIGLNRQDKCFWEGTPEPLRVQGSPGKRQHWPRYQWSHRDWKVDSEGGCSSIYLEQEKQGFNFHLTKERQGGLCKRSGHDTRGRGDQESRSKAQGNNTHAIILLTPGGLFTPTLRVKLFISDVKVKASERDNVFFVVGLFLTV